MDEKQVFETIITTFSGVSGNTVALELVFFVTYIGEVKTAKKIAQNLKSYSRGRDEGSLKPSIRLEFEIVFDGTSFRIKKPSDNVTPGPTEIDATLSGSTPAPIRKPRF